MIKEYRTIAEIAGPLMVVRQVERATFDELVEIELSDGSVRRGKVLEVNGDSAVVQLFEANAGINLAHAKVRFLGHPLQLAVSRGVSTDRRHRTNGSIYELSQRSGSGTNCYPPYGADRRRVFGIS